MPVTIRSAVLGDVPALLAIERETANAAHWIEVQYERRAADGLILAAETGRGICGFVCAREVADVWEIENVVVAEQNRRHVGEHHAERRTRHHAEEVVKARSQRHGGDLRFVAHLGKEERHNGCTEYTEAAAAGIRFFVVELIGDEDPQTHRNEGCG